MKKSIGNIKIKEHVCSQHLINMEYYSFMYYPGVYAHKRCECSICGQVFTRENPANYFSIR